MARGVKQEFDFRKALCEEFQLDYQILGDIYTEKIFWQFNLQNWTDRLGLAQRICKDVANILLSTPIRVTTPNEKINSLIESELFGRLQFNACFSKNLPYFLGIGDGLLTAYRDPIDGKPAINYIPIYNVIPITYNNHTIQKLIWFNELKIDEEQYINCVIEEVGRREIRLYKVNGGRLIVIDYGTPLWIRVMGEGTPQVVEENEINPTRKFAWISTGLFNARWMNTPFHNGFVWPWWLIRKCEWSYNLLQEEYEASKKRIFVNRDMVKVLNSHIQDPISGATQRVKEFDWNQKYYEVADLGEEKIREYNPIVRLNEFKDKFAFDLQLLGMELGLGAEFYSINQMKIEQTATQVVLQHRDAFNTINTIKLNLIPGIQTIVNGLIDYWIEDGLLDESDRLTSIYDIGVKFDDGVFINKGAKVQEGLNLYAAGIIDKFTMLTQYCDYSKAEAEKVIQQKINEDVMQVQFQMAQQAALGPAVQEGEYEEEEDEERKEGRKLAKEEK